MNTLRKQFAVELNVADHERAVLARISTATVDRDGEVLLSQGCDATEFFKSPTVFFNHDYAQPGSQDRFCDAAERSSRPVAA